jgi:DNA-binding IclR family transcriptional regulator
MQSTMSSTAPTKPKKTPRVRPVPAVSRAIAIVRLLGRSQTPLGVKAIADSLGMVTSTCLHIVRVLVDEGLLRVDESTKRYSLGSGLLSLARNAMQTNPFPAIAQPLLDQIADRWRVTTMASEIQDLDHMVVVALSRPKVPFRLHVDVGSRFPPLISATGRLVAAFSQYPRAEIEKRFRLLKWDTPPRFEDWKSDVELARSRRFSVDSNHYIAGVTLVATAVFDSKGRMTHSLTAAGLADQMNDKVVKSLSKDLLRDADELTKLSLA